MGAAFASCAAGFDVACLPWQSCTSVMEQYHVLKPSTYLRSHITTVAKGNALSLLNQEWIFDLGILSYNHVPDCNATPTSWSSQKPSLISKSSLTVPVFSWTRLSSCLLL